MATGEVIDTTVTAAASTRLGARGRRREAWGQMVSSPSFWIGCGVLAAVLAGLVAVSVGVVAMAPWKVALELLDHVPGVRVRSGLSATDASIVWNIRFPRVVLALLVGAMLSVSGGAYQAVFRNPLADPYLLGVAAGAGLGATVVFSFGSSTASRGSFTLPIAAFVGALGAVVLAVGLAGGVKAGVATLVLSGVVIASFLTAVQTFLQQQHADTLREVYGWILGRLSTQGWHEVLVIVPYVVVTSVVLLASARTLDVLRVGDDEAASLGVPVRRVRLTVVAAASLGTAAAVAVSGLIGFVGIVVPHIVRMVAGHSYRIILPVSLLFGAAFLTLADVAARTVQAPAELPIGVVTAFVGAPFFLVVMRTSKSVMS
ncbi:MAG: FecCD family ABC transporter permease [Acidimicrobiia bacterium]